MRLTSVSGGVSFWRTHKDLRMTLGMGSWHRGEDLGAGRTSGVESEVERSFKSNSRK